MTSLQMKDEMSYASTPSFNSIKWIGISSVLQMQCQLTIAYIFSRLNILHVHILNWIEKVVNHFFGVVQSEE